MHGDRWKSVASLHHRVLPSDVDARNDLAERNHASGNGTPDLHALNRRHVASFRQGWTSDDRQQPCFLGIGASAGSSMSRIAIETDDAAFETRLQRLSDIDSRDSVATGLRLEQCRDESPFHARANRAAPLCVPPA